MELSSDTLNSSEFTMFLCVIDTAMNGKEKKQVQLGEIDYPMAE